MVNIISHRCPRCNPHSLYKYGKDKFGNQKYQCCDCLHQFAPVLLKRIILANIRLALSVASVHFFITIMSIILIIVARIRNVIIFKTKQNEDRN